MKIGYIATFPNPEGRSIFKGGYRAISELCKLLQKDNRITLFVASNWKSDEKLTFCHRVIFVPSKNIFLRSFKLCASILRRLNHFDLLIVYNPTIVTFLTLLLSYILRKLTVLQYVDIQGTEVESFGRLRRMILHLLESIALRLSDAYLINSSALATRVRMFRKNARIFTFRGVIETREGRQEENQVAKESEIISVGYIGALIYDNGVDLLVEAVRRVRNKNVQLHIAGQGPMILGLRDLANNLPRGRVIFENVPMGSELDFLKKMDILVVPYRRTYRNLYNFPFKLIEYLWAGKAIVVTNVGDLPKIIKHKVNGLVIKSNDAGAIANAIEILSNDRPLRNSLGSAARADFNDNFSPHKVTKKLNAFLESLIETERMIKL